MVVYADVLVAVNTIIDYFLFKATALFIKKNVGIIRLVFGSLIGGLSSLYIFLNTESIFTDFLFEAIICMIMCAVTFAQFGLKNWIFSSLLMFVIGSTYSGIITALINIFNFQGIYVNNNIVYYQLSPLLLIGLTVGFYIIFTLLRFIFSKNTAVVERCQIEIAYKNKKIFLDAIVDTGNSIEDAMSNSEIIITDEKNAKRLLGDDYKEREELLSRYRKIPCMTVVGNGLLDGYRCDSAIVVSKDKKIKLIKPILLISESKALENGEAIINPRIFLH